MSRYTVLSAYGSEQVDARGVTVHKYADGDVVELDDDVAAWVNRDAPGTLEPVAEPEVDAEPEPEHDPPAVDAVSDSDPGDPPQAAEPEAPVKKTAAKKTAAKKATG